jgi:hypothetical protein
MKLQDIYGIRPRMEKRLNRGGGFTVADLWQASSSPSRSRCCILNHEVSHRRQLARMFTAEILIVRDEGVQVFAPQCVLNVCWIQPNNAARIA